MKKYFLICLSLFLKLTMLIAQEATSISIGQNVPDLEIHNIINYSKESTNLKDFKGKLLILDFWATWCSPCIKAFSKLDSLQKEFQDKIVILPVTTERSQLVNSFFERMTKASSNRVLPSVVEDISLTKLFKHVELPHYVWINSDGKLIAITPGTELTSEKISKVLRGENVVFKEKKDITLNVVNNTSAGIPIFPSVYKKQADGVISFVEVGKKKSLFQSTLTGYTEGLTSGTTNTQNMISAFNVPIIWLYRMAIWKGKQEMLSEDRTIIDIPEGAIYNKLTSQDKNGNSKVSPGMDYENWLREHGYCYELKVPGELNKDKFDFMLDDLNKLFGSLYGIVGEMSNKKIRCLALVRTSTQKKFASESDSAKVVQTKFSASIRKGKMSTLIAILSQPLQNYPPLVDETNFKDRIDVDLECNVGNLIEVNKELAKYDLSLVEKELTVTVGIIRSIPGTFLSKQ